jgi:hypothetical protein
MADSGQQPTAGAEVDTLVDEIFEMQMDMEIKRIDHSSHKLYILYYWTCPPSPQSQCGALAQIYFDAAEKIQTHNIADEAGKPHRSNKLEHHASQPHE